MSFYFGEKSGNDNHFLLGANALGPGGVADDADGIPSIPGGPSTVASSFRSCCGFALACDGCPSPGYTWCCSKDNPGGCSHPSSNGTFRTRRDLCRQPWLHSDDSWIFHPSQGDRFPEPLFWIDVGVLQRQLVPQSQRVAMQRQCPRRRRSLTL